MRLRAYSSWMVVVLALEATVLHFQWSCDRGLLHTLSSVLLVPSRGLAPLPQVLALALVLLAWRARPAWFACALGVAGITTWVFLANLGHSLSIT